MFLSLLLPSSEYHVKNVGKE